LRLLSDHWQLFKHIANHANFNELWQNEILFFSEDWFKPHKKDAHWYEFKLYLFREGWLQSQQSIKKEQFGLFWQKYNTLIAKRRLQPPPYLSDTLKHLLLVSSSEAPAIQPIHNSELAAPIHGLQKAILDVYQLKKDYAPTIMHSIIPNKNNNNPVYYSLSFPTLLEGTPESKHSSSTIMLDMRDIKLLLDTLLRDPTIEQSFLKGMSFSYFHVEDDIYHEIKSSKLIPEEDNRFNDQLFKNLSFCSTSPFWRGCIRITFS
jgi:hypothetical protein